jgi:2-amino-4-hydroxy-6-hydroxymethyldihydropteridine diphosphokinase
MILIAIGCNLPGRFATTRDAANAAGNALEHLLGPARRSRWYLTAPVPPSDQPDYINGVLAFPREAEPAALLAALHAIERDWGRVRSVPDAARPLDLDILAIGDLVRAAPDPVLPHPRLHVRRFVLEPLRDVAPGFVHPVLGLGVDAMLAALPTGGIRLAEAEGG